MATTKSTSIAVATLVAMGLGTAAAPAVAAPAEPFQIAQADSFSDEKLQAFVVALLDVENIRQSYTQAVAEADDEEARVGLIQTAQREMVQAVEEAPGITIDEYDAISAAAQTDPDLTRRINSMIEAEAR